jgi:hypothetical protein
MPDERSLAEEVGFDLFLGKPCDPDTVLNEILRLMADRKHESRKNEPSA